MAENVLLVTLIRDQIRISRVELELDYRLFATLLYDAATVL